MVGDALLDRIVSLPYIPAAGGSVFGPPPTLRFGGAGGNVAAALARLGLRTGFIGRVGRDEEGRAIRADLEAAGVDTGGLIDDAEHGTGSVIALVGPGDARVMIGCILDAAQGHLAASDLDWPPFQSAPFVQVSGLLMAEQPGRGVALLALRLAAERGTEVHYDANLRAAEADPRGEQSAAHWEAMVRATVVTATEEELSLLGRRHAGISAELAPDIAARATAAALYQREHGACPQLIVVKQGVRGATALLPDGSAVASPGYRVLVVDAIGAGDVFAAALIVARRQRLELAAALDFANAAAALSVTVPGGRGAPTVAEIVDRQRRGR